VYDSITKFADLGPARTRMDDLIRGIVIECMDGRVLEIGSQAWASFFRRDRLQPRSIVCINISTAELAKGKSDADRFGFQAEFQIMDAHNLEFPADTFDLVYGTAILHHLDYTRALNEIHRVLKPGGTMLFVEPLIGNPAARLVRFLTPRARTPDERPLGRKELSLIRSRFLTRFHYFELFHFPLAIVSRLISTTPDNGLARVGDFVDSAILSIMPWVGPYFRTVVIHGIKKRSN